jgi:hypothetical protein
MVAFRHSPLEYRPAAPAEESSSLTTAGSRACRGCPQGWPRTPQSTVRLRQPPPWLAFTRLKASQTSRLGILNGFASSTGSSRFQLARGQGRTTQPLRSSPITGPSSLLRAAPPLRPASVLSPSRLEPLAACPFTSSDVTQHRFSRSVRKPGRASRRLYAGCRSSSIRASPELIPEEGSPPGSDIA